MLRTRSRADRWWSQGHGTLLDDVAGNWWVMYHAYENGYRTLGRQTLLMSRELYAVPVLIGCILFTLILAYAPEYRHEGSIFCIGLIFAIRAAAIHWSLQVPEWAMMGSRRQ